MPELLIVLATIGILGVIVVPRLAGWRDALATNRAVREVASFYARARLTAIMRGRRVRVEFGEDSLRAILEGPPDSVSAVQPGPAQHGVSLSASRQVVRLSPTGIGWGAANTRLVLRRGAAAESLTTSRLGRLKLWQ